MPNILVLYYSKHGSTRRLAEEIAYGIEQQDQGIAILRTVPEISAVHEKLEDSVPASGAPYVSVDDFNQADGLLLGSPGYFGNMCSQMKYFLDQTSSSWLAGKMIGKPAAVFTSTSSMHGGQESVLLSMMLPLLHHGMVFGGIPYSESCLHKTQTGASPYGATHLANDSNNQLSDDEIQAARFLGQRIASLATHLKDFNS